MEKVIACPSCGLRAQLPDAHPGGDLACPDCHVVFAVGGPAEPAAAAEPALAVYVGGGDAPFTAPAAGGFEAGPADQAAVLDWLRAEAKRFNDHVARQLAGLDRRRQELAAGESKAEAAFVARGHDLNRRQALLAARTEAVRKREEEAARREQELAPAADRLAAREEAAAARERALDALRDEAAELERRAADLRPQVEGMEARRADLAVELAPLAEQRAALSARQAAVEREEQALRRREADLDDLEAQLRRELEERERELAAGQRLLRQQQEAAG